MALMSIGGTKNSDDNFEPDLNQPAGGLLTAN